LTDEQKEILVGTCLGDLNIRQIGKFSRLVFEQKNKDYLFHLYTKFESFTKTPPKERQQRRTAFSQIKSTWYFSTISHSSFHEYRLNFYPSSKKEIPANLQDIITCRSLAYWYMDDGGLINNSPSFSTASFSLRENEKLSQILLDKFNIQTSIHGLASKTKYLSLYVKRDSLDHFKSLVEPYLVSSMLYKIPKPVSPHISVK
jgi:hypothetical protein